MNLQLITYWSVQYRLIRILEDWVEVELYTSHLNNAWYSNFKEPFRLTDNKQPSLSSNYGKSPYLCHFIFAYRIGVPLANTLKVTKHLMINYKETGDGAEVDALATENDWAVMLDLDCDITSSMIRCSPLL